MKHLLCLLLLLFCTSAEAGWIQASPIRHSTNPSLSPVLVDIDTHLDAGHPYNDDNSVSFGHEGTHGVNSWLRNHRGQRCFYVLNNHAYQFQPIPGTLAEAAAFVPPSLRGSCYWFMAPSNWWYSDPAHILDEFTAYTNGTVVRRSQQRADRTDTVQFMIEFIVYSTATVACTRGITTSDHTTYLKYAIERAMFEYRQSHTNCEPYLNRLRHSQDAAALRNYMQATYGAKWTKTWLGF